MEMKKLIDQVLHGEPDAFEPIVRNLERKIYTFLKGYRGQARCR
ncbi:hypothetical protein ACFFNY_31790 [Paenibacillus hodogayensis]|uniref:Uncharacterized protein n=1 Tax=Paenibacillus hodogayensis TaxID=279208 RepID=A0ABV5W6J1_9BACL